MTSCTYLLTDLSQIITCGERLKVGSLQHIVTETILGRKNSVQGPLLLKLLFLGLKTMSPSIHYKDNTARNKEAHWLIFDNALISLFNSVIL